MHMPHNTTVLCGAMVLIQQWNHGQRSVKGTDYRQQALAQEEWCHLSLEPRSTCMMLRTSLKMSCGICH